jgi:hypothetical protein
MELVSSTYTPPILLYDVHRYISVKIKFQELHFFYEIIKKSENTKVQDISFYCRYIIRINLAGETTISQGTRTLRDGRERNGNYLPIVAVSFPQLSEAAVVN